VGVVFIDVETGEVIVEHNAEELLNPASNAKIVTAAAALSILGPEYRYETALYGTIVGNAIDGPLYLRGRGDPSLGLEDLWALAAELRRRNVRAVRGDIVVDGTYFESETEPPAFDQQPNERAYFRAPVGAVNVNRNVVYIHVRPSSGAGRPALVTAEPSGYLDLTNDTTTLEGGAPSIRISTRAADGGTAARVWGSLPLGHVGMRRRSRIDNPSLFAGAALQEALTSLGIRVRGRVREGAMSSSNRLLAQHRSDPLSAMIWEVGKNSDNFTAETLLITLGAQREQPGTWEAGREAVRGFMTSIGIDREAYRVVNGSGLFDANRYTPRQLATVLQAMWRDQTVRAEFIAQLATGGVDGTLSRRFTSAPALRNVRAKTGTLSDVTALSGYVLAPPGRHTLAFSILINGARGRLGRGRNLQDALVTAAAEHLHRVQ
jgi:D-alanyl-D-alanine carboxypeptidase/D-alanyl-D-alanine-endopeptidase (penicillin-binding protein 4)